MIAQTHPGVRLPLFLTILDSQFGTVVPGSHVPRAVLHIIRGPSSRSRRMCTLTGAGVALLPGCTVARPHSRIRLVRARCMT